MSTIQMVGIAIAAVIVLLLVVALIVTRKPGEGEMGEAQDSAGAPSFLDSPPSDTLAKLGRPEPDSALGPDAGAGGAGLGAAATALAAAVSAATSEEDLRLEWDGAPAPADDTGTTGEMKAADAAPVDDRTPGEPAAPAGEAGGEPPTQPGQVRPGATEAAAAAAGQTTGGKLVPLSSIIVTTSTKMVDLEDPEIRRMLTELVTFEIDQATQFREQGQTIDAVLQLTEAEKICRALGKQDTAREIRDMMRDLQA